MKILQIANKFPFPPRDGGSIATMVIARSFVELGHDVTILAMNTSKHFVPALPDPFSESGIKFIAVPVDTEIRILRMAGNFFFSGLPYNAERFISREFEDKLKELLTTSEFDIIQLEGLYLAPYLKTIRNFSSARVAMRAHNIEHEIWARACHQEKGIRKIYIRNLATRIKRMERAFLNEYDAVIPITKRDAGVLRDLGCHLPVHVTPTGVDAGDIQFSYEEMEYPSVFHIGALDWIPNQEGIAWFLDQVWERILKKFPDVNFYLAGRNAPERMKNLTCRNLVFLGEVEDAYALIKSKAVMIVPVLSGSGMRIKIIEGMVYGRAVVTTTIGTEGISTTHGENVLISDDPVQFAEEICRLLGNLNYYMEIGQKARKFVVKEYDNKTITRSLIAFYQNLIS